MVADLLDAQLAVAEQGLGFECDVFVHPLHTVLPADLLDCGAEVFWCEAHAVGIEADASLLRKPFFQECEEVVEDLFLAVEGLGYLWRVLAPVVERDVFEHPYLAVALYDFFLVKVGFGVELGAYHPVHLYVAFDNIGRDVACEIVIISVCEVQTHTEVFSHGIHVLCLKDDAAETSVIGHALTLENATWHYHELLPSMDRYLVQVDEQVYLALQQGYGEECLALDGKGRVPFCVWELACEVVEGDDEVLQTTSPEVLWQLCYVK